MKNTVCMKIRKEVISVRPPKSCTLHLTVSDKVSDVRFISTIYEAFARRCEAPTKLNRLSDKEFSVDIGSSFRRCSDCTYLINRFRGFMNANVIEEDGNCDYRRRRSANFQFEDYFD